MAIIIRHGPNGSYKSATIVFKHIIDALRKGRLVVTNMEGMYPIDYIQKQLNETFPEGAQLIRIGSLTDSQKELWRNWFSWMPLQAFIVIDECQSIFKTTMKGQIYLRPFSDFEDSLPASLKVAYHLNKKLIKADDFDEGDTDDTGILRFNDDGSIIYPDTLSDAFERHRKFNWDIVFGTPKLTDVSGTVRACAEKAFAHRGRDEVFFTKRKPRIYEHSPQSTGLTPKKEDCHVIKVPLWAFLCYKSTQTGSQTKSGQGVNPLKNPKFIAIMGVILVSTSYFIYTMYNILAVPNEPLPLQAETISKEIKNNKVISTPNKKDPKIDKTGSNQSNPLTDYNDLLSLSSRGNLGIDSLGVNLPYGAISIYLIAYVGDQFLFKVQLPDNSFIHVTNKDLDLISWRVQSVKNGLVKLTNILTNHVFYCVILNKSIYQNINQQMNVPATDVSDVRMVSN